MAWKLPKRTLIFDSNKHNLPFIMISSFDQETLYVQSLTKGTFFVCDMSPICPWNMEYIILTRYVERKNRKKYDNSTNNRNEKLIFPRKITDTHTVSQFQIYTIAFCISTCFYQNTWIHNHC